MSEQTVAVALGSNLGNRADNLARARQMLAESAGSLLAASRIYETDPVGPPGQGRFLNQVLLLHTPLEPEAILERALGIEARLGRVRVQRNGPRTIDLDLLLHGSRVCATEQLSLPHPRMHERPFVLVPLCELLPAWRHPLRGETVRDMLAASGGAGVRVWAPNAETSDPAGVAHGN